MKKRSSNRKKEKKEKNLLERERRKFESDAEFRDKNVKIGDHIEAEIRDKGSHKVR